MDNRNVIEEIFNNVQTKSIGLIEAIQENYLPNPEYHCGLYEITTKERERILKLNDEPLKNQILNYDIDGSIENIFRENLDLSKDHKIICFVDKISNINEGINNIKKWIKREINVYKLHSKQSKVLNKEQINKFQNTKGLNIIFAVNMLNEGVHFPGTDCVIFLRKTSSNIVYLQQLGRVLGDNVENPKVFDLVNNINNLNNGYAQLISNRVNELKIKPEDLQTKNGEKLKITTHQVDLIDMLNKTISYTYEHYSEEEDNILKEKSAESTIEELSKLLPNRTINSIRCRLEFLKLTYKKEKEVNGFTKEEDNILIGKHEISTVSELSYELNRPLESIKARCKILKIKPILVSDKNRAFIENLIVEKLKTIKHNEYNLGDFENKVVFLSYYYSGLIKKLDIDHKLIYRSTNQQNKKEAHFIKSHNIKYTQLYEEGVYEDIKYRIEVLNETQIAVAKDYNVPKSVMQVYCSSRNITSTYGDKCRLDPYLKEIKYDREIIGMTINNLAKKYHCSTGTITGFIKTNKIERRGKE